MKIVHKRPASAKVPILQYMSIKILLLAILALVISTPAMADLLYICNDSKDTYYDKANKKGPFDAFVSATVTINTDNNTAELILGSRRVPKIGTRSNSDMSLLVEKEKSQILFTGITPDESIYFTLYTEELFLIASYEDIVVRIKGCINMLSGLKK